MTSDAVKPTEPTARARESMRHGKLKQPALKFVVLPSWQALPAFRLHKHIAYGGTFGEYYSFSLKAYLTILGLWWVTWAIGVANSAAILRLAIEAISFFTAQLRPQHAIDSRYLIKRLGLAALYLGMPVWLVWRITGAN